MASGMGTVKCRIWLDLPLAGVVGILAYSPFLTYLKKRGSHQRCLPLFSTLGERIHQARHDEAPLHVPGRFGVSFGNIYKLKIDNLDHFWHLGSEKGPKLTKKRAQNAQTFSKFWICAFYTMCFLRIAPPP